MTNLAGQTVLDLAILADMYGDDSAQTICEVLSRFRAEAKIYMVKLEQAAQAGQFSEIARLSHSLKSLCGLVGAVQLMVLCQSAEQAARRSEQSSLTDSWLILDTVWPALLAELDSSLQLRNDTNA